MLRLYGIPPSVMLYIPDVTLLYVGCQLVAAVWTLIHTGHSLEDDQTVNESVFACYTHCHIQSYLPRGNSQKHLVCCTNMTFAAALVATRIQAVATLLNYASSRL